jgi:predicted RNA-binding Zn-ribbon protein involved in translation (DUF1610 family)
MDDTTNVGSPTVPTDSQLSIGSGLAESGLNSARIAWLEKAYALLRSELLPEAPERVTISFGFPSKGARPSRNQRIGEYAHFLQDCDAGPGLLTLHPTIFEDPSRVLDVLLHEMIHAARPTDGHKKDFPKLAKRVGLTGKMTATVASPELRDRLNAMLRDKLPAMPKGHGDLTTNRKKAGTRLRKWVCPSCGQIIRAASDCLNAVCGDCNTQFEIAG